MINQGLRLSIVTLVLIAFAALAAPASAGVLYYTFSFSGDGVSGDGSFFTAATPDPSAPLSGGYDILSISGEVNGAAITGLVGEIGGPTAYSPDGYFLYDNDFYLAGADSAAGAYFDDDGLLLETAGTDYNLFYDGTNYWYWADQGASSAVVSFTAVDPPAPVPEPPSGWLFAAMLAALLCFGRTRTRVLPSRR